MHMVSNFQHKVVHEDFVDSYHYSYNYAGWYYQLAAYVRRHVTHFRVAKIVVKVFSRICGLGDMITYSLANKRPDDF